MWPWRQPASRPDRRPDPPRTRGDRTRTGTWSGALRPRRSIRGQPAAGAGARPMRTRHAVRPGEGAGVLRFELVAERSGIVVVHQDERLAGSQSVERGEDRLVAGCRHQGAHVEDRSTSRAVPLLELVFHGSEQAGDGHLAVGHQGGQEDLVLRADVGVEQVGHVGGGGRGTGSVIGHGHPVDQAGQDPMLLAHRRHRARQAGAVGGSPVQRVLLGQGVRQHLRGQVGDQVAGGRLPRPRPLHGVGHRTGPAGHLVVELAVVGDDGRQCPELLVPRDHRAHRLHAAGPGPVRRHPASSRSGRSRFSSFC